MNMLKKISTAMIIMGIIAFIAGIIITMKELLEFGLCIGIAGIIGYAIVFVKSSTSIVNPKSNFD